MKLIIFGELGLLKSPSDELNINALNKFRKKYIVDSFIKVLKIKIIKNKIFMLLKKPVQIALG